MDIQDQAMVFATINLKQTKVNKSLAYDLYEFTTSRSPQKTCHDIARFLNYKEDSPFRKKIKMLGVATGASETLTQATFVDRLLRLISRDPMGDRDRIKRHKSLERAIGPAASRQIFRDEWRGKVSDVWIQHDDWCNCLKGKTPCNCDPDIILEMPTGVFVVDRDGNAHASARA